MASEHQNGPPAPVPRAENTDETVVSVNRTTLGRVAGIGIFLWVLLVAPPAFIPPLLALIGEAIGFVLLAAAAFGRLWCLIYIAGSKNRVLQTEGPYSVVRNPLYFFSFLGAVGFGFAVHNPFVAVAAIGVFILFHAPTVIAEEGHLAKLFGKDFEDYRARVPRWVPNWSLFREPQERLPVDARKVRKGMLDAMWFLWAYLLWLLLDGLRMAGVVPAL